MTTLRTAIVAIAALVCAACATPPSPEPAPPAPPPPAAAPPVQEPAPPPPPTPPPPVTAQSELELGIKSYEDGDYKSADKYLQTALEMGLASPASQARAHKYRAFIVCVNGREKPCRDEFRKALEADPNFVLAPAEAGHPVWSQVMRSVKAEIASAKNKPAPAATPRPPKPAAPAGATPAAKS